MVAQVSSAGNCCGAQILAGFTGSETEVRKELKDHIKSRYHNQAAITTIFLNDGQQLRYGKIMEDEGYKLVVSGAHNAKHDSKIYMYVHVFRPEKSDPVLFPAAEVDY